MSEPASELAAREPLLAALILQSDVPALVFDRDFRVRAANPAFCALIGCTAAEVIGRNFLGTLQSPSVEAVRRLRALDAGRHEQAQVWHVMGTGEPPVAVEYSFVALQGPERLLGGFARLRSGDQMLIEQLAHLYDELDKRHRELKRLHRRIERLADTDELTNLPNRRAFEAGFEREWLRHRRNQKPLSLVLFDVDRFKSINDRYGHVRGDFVLESVGRVLRAGVRATDLPARYGGEEFAVVLPETETPSAIRTAERLREAIAELRFPEVGSEFQITASAGVATSGGDFRPSDRLVLFVAADTALRTAKERGRDRVEVHRA
jgi:diguanylate cyclase (GGDEF)-like protein